MMNTFLTSLLFAALVDIGACDSNTCQEDETNFTRPVLVFEEEARTSTMYRWQKRKPDCSGWDRTWSWATHKCDELNVLVSYIHVSYITVSKTANVVECCPGYTNTSGDCVQGCAKGTYGANCSLNCSCANNSTLNQCDQDTGYCLCPPGYYGLNCTHECGKGYYGSNCSYACTCANNATCNKQNGKCNCTETPGWTGNACEKRPTHNETAESGASNPFPVSTLAGIIGGVCVVVVVVVVVVAATFIVRRNRRRNASRKSGLIEGIRMQAVANSTFVTCQEPSSDINNIINGSDEVSSDESTRTDNIINGSDEVTSDESTRTDNIIDDSEEVKSGESTRTLCD